jgi:hypothetical protein
MFVPEYAYQLVLLGALPMWNLSIVTALRFSEISRYMLKVLG